MSVANAQRSANGQPGISSFSDGTVPRMLTGKQIGAASTNDVAVLRPGGLGVDPVPLALGDPSPGEAVWVSGYSHERIADSLADGLVVTPAHVVGYMSGRTVGEQGRVMRVDVPVRAGMSGGAVLDEAGRLAGLVFAMEGANSGLVIPTSTLRRVVSRGGLTQPRSC